MTAAEVSSLRSALGIGRSTFAGVLGVSERTVRRWERSGTDETGPAVEIARALARWVAKPKSTNVIRTLVTRSTGLNNMLDVLLDAMTTMEYLRIR